MNKVHHAAPARTSRSNGSSDLSAISHKLGERLKELNCLYGISRLVERVDRSIPEILHGVVDLIPPAWQYPEVTCARIRFRKSLHQTHGFASSPWQQIEPIIVNGRTAGSLEVGYLAERPPEFEGPFLKEERDLIHGIAERLGHIISAKLAEHELHRAFAREKRLRRKLQHEMDNRVVFTRQLVHELKTGLTSVLATSHLLTEETAGTRLEKLSQYVWRGASSLDRRVDELHDMIRGELGKLALDLTEIDIFALLRALVEETGPLVMEYGMTIALRDPESLPKVRADGDRVRQIMLNLINNACKYASDGKRIDVAVDQVPGSAEVLIAVTDYGPGIPRHRQRSLFTPAYQSESPVDFGAGLGIGLALCKMLVGLHGGRIWLESPPGAGCRFLFTLPVAGSYR
jgi:signal transduction histidine kinase